MHLKQSFLSPQPRGVKNLLESKIVNRLLKEKRGQGYGKDYKPFLTVRDVPSKGRVHRRPSLTNNRIVHLLSDLELAAFLLFDWQPSVTEIREQFPLNPEATSDIATRLGIKHPAYKGVFQVMTTDLLVDLQVNGKSVLHAISVKYADELDNKRTIEKQEMERRFWENEGVDFYLFTERDVPKTTIKNIRWLAPHMHSFNLNADEQISVFERIAKALDANSGEKIPLPLKELDLRFKLAVGTHLQYFRHFAAQNAFIWNMHSVPHTKLLTQDISLSEYWINQEANYVYAK